MALAAPWASAEGVLPSPRILYHWSSDEALEPWADAIRKAGRFVNKGPMPSVLTTIYAELAGRPLTYAWSHPVTGMGRHAAELYFLPTNPKLERIPSTRPPRLVLMRVRKGARVVVLDTHSSMRDWWRAMPPEAANADVILHRLHTRPKGGASRLDYQEWVILNPDAIEAVTADPQMGRPIVERELQRLRNPRHRYRPEEMHSPHTDFGNAERATITSTLEKYLASGAEGLAPEWRQAWPEPSLAAGFGCRVRDLLSSLVRAR